MSKCLCVGVLRRYGKRRTERVVAIPRLDCPSHVMGLGEEEKEGVCREEEGNKGEVQG